MVESIIEYSSKNRFIVILLTLILTLISFAYVKDISLDALPDLSPPQVILEVNYPSQSPKVIEEQLTYPLVSSLMSLKGIETIRAMSNYEDAMIYIIFKDDVNIYDARAVVLEKLSSLIPTLPQSAKISLGPDATGVGWAYEYILKSNKLDLGELREYQDYYLKYALGSIDGVSEVSSVGGFVKNYEITLNQDRMIFYDIDIKDVVDVVQKSNGTSGAGVILQNGYESPIQARGYLKGIDDLKDIVIKQTPNLPIKLQDIADIKILPDARRGVAELNGEGEVVGGIVVVRYNQSPYDIVKKVKQKIASIKDDSVQIVQTYDRTKIIDKAIATLRDTLIKEFLVVSFIVFLFLSHLRSSLIIIITLPLSILFTFLAMSLFKIESNIMSLGGIAIAIGAMIDASIVMIENAHKHLSAKDDKRDRITIIVESAKEVGRPIFFALMLVVISFLPIFALTNQEQKLFAPLAFTKSFAMGIGAIISIVLVPALMVLFIKGDIKQTNFINSFFEKLYTPLLEFLLKFRYIALLLLFGSTIFIYPLYKSQKWEFMPMLNEEDMMYMPISSSGIGVDMAKDVLQYSDKLIKSIPEVQSVFGKAGRANSATDPAPLDMLESIITLKDRSLWREGMSYEKLRYELEKKLDIKGFINSWTYPIRGRIDMLITGIRTPLGIKIYGDDTKKLESIALEFEQRLAKLDLSLSVSSDKTSKANFLDIELHQDALDLYGLTKEDILNTLNYGVGGVSISTKIDALKRFNITARLEHNTRDDWQKLNSLMIKTALGYKPLDTFATIKQIEEPSTINSEKGMRVSFVYITPKSGISPTLYKQEATKLLKSITLPSGYYYEFSGQSEFLQSAMERLSYITPIVLIIIFLLIYLALRDISNTFIVFLTLPFAFFGGLIYVDHIGFNFSIAVVVGFLALLGVAAQAAIVMMIYLQNASKKFPDDFHKATIYGSVARLRPKLMSVFALLAGLIPIMFSSGVGSEVMRRIAAPMIGGLATSAILTLFIIPLLYYAKNEYITSRR